MQRDVCVRDLHSPLFVHCGEKDDPIEKELATLLADLRYFLWNGVEVLSSQDDRFWSAVGRNAILNVEEFRDEQSSVRVWSMDFFRKNGRPAQFLKPEMFYVWCKASTCSIAEVVAPSES